MTLDDHENWRKTTLKQCLADGTCKPHDLSLAWCRYRGAKSRTCGYDTCPMRRYYKTDGMCTVLESEGGTTVIMWDDGIRISLKPDRVRFLARALSDVVKKLESEKMELQQ